MTVQRLKRCVMLCTFTRHKLRWKKNFLKKHCVRNNYILRVSNIRRQANLSKEYCNQMFPFIIA